MPQGQNDWTKTHSITELLNIIDDLSMAFGAHHLAIEADGKRT